ncbi:MAG: helix-turn-helix transcriptional regulator [Candidatus Nitrotoga sp.]
MSKPKEEEQRLLVTGESIPANATASKVAASVHNVQKNAAKMNEYSLTDVAVYAISNTVGVVNGRRKVLIGKLQDKKYRDAYVRATITHGLAHQIRTNRESRKLSQQSLADKCGGRTTQAVISRLEDPAYGKFTLNSVLKVAAALDVAVLVRLVPYSKFILESTDKSILGLYAKSFSEENLHSERAFVTFTETDKKPLAQPYMAIRHLPKVADLRVVVKQTEQIDARCSYAYMKSS